MNAAIAANRPQAVYNIKDKPDLTTVCHGLSQPVDIVDLPRKLFYTLSTREYARWQRGGTYSLSESVNDAVIPQAAYNIIKLKQTLA